MESAPARTFWCEARKRERVRCSSLVDWPVYPRLAHTMRASNGAQCGVRRGCAARRGARHGWRPSDRSRHRARPSRLVSGDPRQTLAWWVGPSRQVIGSGGAYPWYGYHGRIGGPRHSATKPADQPGRTLSVVCGGSGTAKGGKFGRFLPPFWERRSPLLKSLRNPMCSRGLHHPSTRHIQLRVGVKPLGRAAVKAATAALYILLMATNYAAR